MSPTAPSKLAVLSQTPCTTEPETAESSSVWSYKPSGYNHFVDRGDTVWAVNFRSTAFVRFSPEEFARVQAILDTSERGETPKGLADVESLVDQLVQWQFLIPRKMDETAILKIRNRNARFRTDLGLALVIAPTLRCNFGCEYCYVDLNANKMSPDDREKVGKFFHRKLPPGTLANVCWTGGDPSLAMDVVEDLSQRFLRSCEEKEAHYTAHLITNGYLLDEKMMGHLRRSSIHRLQISLDGNREFHNQTRKLVNGKPTYDTILDNTARAVEEFKIALRINVDINNHHTIPEVLEDLAARGLSSNPNVQIYYARVDDVNEQSHAYHENCLTPERYAKIENGLMQRAVDMGFYYAGRAFSTPVKSFCGANSNSYFVIDSKANLLKCYHDLGSADELGIGRIGDDGEEIVTNPYNLFKWLDWDPFEIEECRSCKLLPVCMGGCSHAIMRDGLKVDRGCVKLRFSMDETIELIGKSLSDGKGASLGNCGCAAATAFPKA